MLHVLGHLPRICILSQTVPFLIVGHIFLLSGTPFCFRMRVHYHGTRLGGCGFAQLLIHPWRVPLQSTSVKKVLVMMIVK